MSSLLFIIVKKSYLYGEKFSKLFGNVPLIYFFFQVEDSSIFSFSLNFHLQEGSEKHLFVAVNLRSMNQVIYVLTQIWFGECN